VITPSAGGPAERAGIEPRDMLLAIDDRPMQNISLYEAGDLLQGTEGTEVPATYPYGFPESQHYHCRLCLCLTLRVGRVTCTWAYAACLIQAMKQDSKCPQVVLKLQPHSGKGVREVKLKREKIKINPVTSQLCGSASQAVTEAASSTEAPAAGGAGKIGYIRVATFSKQTPESARTALQNLKADGADRWAHRYHASLQALHSVLRCP
jgi:C-terminal processing protease CtpA/Prc